jgi:hypothetical protein
MVLLMFLVVFFSIGDFGQLFLLHYTLVERARAAARGGAVNGHTDQEMTNFVMHGTYTAGSGTGTFGLTSANVHITRTGSAANASALVTVAISNLSYQSVSPLLGRQLKNMPVRVVVSSEAP